MQGQQAIIVTEYELQQMLAQAGKAAAQEVISSFKAELTDDPTEATTRKLRAYIADRSTVLNPRDMWANALHIRSIKLNSRHKPLSVSWFQKFKKISGLDACFFRPSTATGGRTEWCFEDIANAWEKNL